MDGVRALHALSSEIAML